MLQLVAARSQQRTQFEDQVAGEYRSIVHDIPVEALLGEDLSTSLDARHLADFYRYLDLTNEQIFLRMGGRVRGRTWRDWVKGINGNMSRPAFQSAWLELQRRAPSDFVELRELQRRSYSDPWKWTPFYKRWLKRPLELS